MSDPTLPDEASIYRGVRGAHLRDGELTFAAFLLRKPRDGEPPETGLSVSTNALAAFDSLKNLKGVAEANVGRVRSLEDPFGNDLGLDVVPKPNAADPGYAWVVGLPLWDEPETENQRRANDFAEAMLSIAKYLAGRPG